MKAIRVAVVCYAIESGRGSEQGSGYNFCRNLLKHSDLDVTVFTRPNNAVALATDPQFEGVQIIGHDPPRWLTFWKRGGRGIIPYYYVWQWFMAQKIRREGSFDVVHQYNFHTDWAPHFLGGAAQRIVWGPICHQPRLPATYFRGLPLRRRAADLVRWLTKNLFWRTDPNLRAAIRRSDVILYANEDVAPPFRSAAGLRFQTFGGVSWENSPPRGSRTGTDQLRFLHVGRSVEIKGAHLAVRAFEIFLRNGGAGSLTLVGDGPLRPHLRRLIDELGLADSAEIVPWLRPSEVAVQYGNADVMIYPSLGNQDTVVAEALAVGLPVLCLEDSGAAFMAGQAGVVATTADGKDIDSALADQMLRLHSLRADDPTAFELLQTAALQRAEQVSWSGTARDIADIYRELIQ